MVTLRSVLAFLLLAAGARAQYAIDGISFGHKGDISPNGQFIPGWSLSGDGHVPQVLSDRIILTPPAPGSARGSLWATSPVQHGEWTAEFEFRASGQERGSGKLNLWYVKNGRGTVGQSSVYTIGKFDGFVLVVDQYGGKGGSIRGFLNDESASFKDHHNVDSLAFGHCTYAYRNLGRPSKLRIENGQHGLKVEIDDTICFSSEKVSLPSNYYFGISAASAENPDSFELNKFLLSTTNSITREEVPSRNNADQQGQSKRPAIERLSKLPEAPEIIPDEDPTTITTQEEQFADLHNRLQGMTHQIANIFSEFERLSQTLEERHTELLAVVSSAGSATSGSQSDSSGASNNAEALLQLSRRLGGIERTVNAIQKDVEGRDYKEHLSNLQQSIEGVRGGLTEHLPETITNIIATSAPRMGTFIFVVIAFQVMLAGAYIVYKKRRANAPKKYL